MPVKKIVSIVLMLFLGASILYLTISETNKPAQDSLSQKTQTTGQMDIAESGRVVTATYYHGNTRCATCNKLETYSQEAINTHLATLVDKGILVWQTINYEESPNEHFVSDYQMAYQSLILQEYVDGEPGEFVDLKRIWDLVGDEDAFVEYVAKEITTFVEQL